MLVVRVSMFHFVGSQTSNNKQLFLAGTSEKPTHLSQYKRMFHFWAHNYEAALYYITLSMQVCTLPFLKGFRLVIINCMSWVGSCSESCRMSPYTCISWFLFNQGIIQKTSILFSSSMLLLSASQLYFKFVTLKTRTEFGHFSVVNVLYFWGESQISFFCCTASQKQLVCV